MLHIVSPSLRDFYRKDLENYFRLRKKILIDERGWDLTSEDEKETDQFDHEQAHYLLYKSYATGEVLGGVRLTPSLAPNLTIDVFSSLIKEDNAFSPSPKIWESSRFVTESVKNERHKGIIKEVTIILFIGMIEYGLRQGIESLVMLTEIRLERIGRMLHWHLHRLGDVKKVGNTLAVTGLAEISEKACHRVRRSGGISHNIFYPFPQRKHARKPSTFADIYKIFI